MSDEIRVIATIGPCDWYFIQSHGRVKLWMPCKFITGPKEELANKLGFDYRDHITDMKLFRNLYGAGYIEKLTGFNQRNDFSTLSGEDVANIKWRTAGTLKNALQIL